LLSGNGEVCANRRDAATPTLEATPEERSDLLEIRHLLRARKGRSFTVDTGSRVTRSGGFRNQSNGSSRTA
jgi:hypothetical protein